MGRGSCQAELRLFARALCCCRWLSPVPRAQRTHKHQHPKLQRPAAGKSKARQRQGTYVRDGASVRDGRLRRGPGCGCPLGDAPSRGRAEGSTCGTQRQRVGGRIRPNLWRVEGLRRSPPGDVSLKSRALHNSSNPGPQGTQPWGWEVQTILLKLSPPCCLCGGARQIYGPERKHSLPQPLLMWSEHISREMELRVV